MVGINWCGQAVEEWVEDRVWIEEEEEAPVGSEGGGGTSRRRSF